MGKGASKVTVDRQWRLIQLIPKCPPGRTCEELWESLKDEGIFVTKRTVQRDLDTLTVYNLTNTATQKYHGNQPLRWYFTHDPGTVLSGMALDEAVALKLAGEVMGNVLPPVFHTALKSRFEGARKKLDEMSGNELVSLENQIRYAGEGIRTINPEISPKLLERLYEGLRLGRKLRVTYASLNDDPKPPELKGKITDRVIDPLGLIFQSGRGYLVVQQDSLNDFRTYALQRIRNVEVLGQARELPKGYTLDQYIAEQKHEFGTGKLLKLKAIVSNKLGMLLENYKLSEDQKIGTCEDSPKQWKLTVTVRDTWRLEEWILGRAGDIQVLSPKVLKERIRKRHEEALVRYR